MEATIVALARGIGEWFPDLGGRSIAVSEVDPFDNLSNIPTLPLAVTALVQESANQGPANGKIVITSDVVVEFIFKPTKYDTQNGEKTPFFAFYDYETLRDKLLSHTRSWRSPRGVGLSYRGLGVESDEFAVYISVRFSLSEQWCEPDLDEEPQPVQISSLICQPRVLCEPCCDEPPDPCST